MIRKFTLLVGFTHSMMMQCVLSAKYAYRDIPWGFPVLYTIYTFNAYDFCIMISFTTIMCYWTIIYGGYQV